MVKASTTKIVMEGIQEGFFQPVDPNDWLYIYIYIYK